jgi:ankyrin repeat protein
MSHSMADPHTWQALLAAGGDPNKLDGEGWTPLMIVCGQNYFAEKRVSLARVLLEAGARETISMRGKDGKSVLTLAQDPAFKGSGMVELLMANGAD